ncbi:hypothetical protein BDEG_25517 [Batrachochytrium dendrobatidis JEL423]|uniref:Uncharacterized protein n=1 Tax=Batrachochytrium dendrobatidis (strain JEL423) TaxID=403673 RepID=A0A177WQA8_BATDL|nr:hypothetical protein BDEG_25517 [Batrachochytrium dendrobatidis JEL423]
MGCNYSTEQSADILENKKSKQHAIAAIETGNLWRKKWLEFTDAMEQSQLTGAHWAQDESNELLKACFKSLSIQSTEIYIISRGFISALEAHLSLLQDILSLQRDFHASLKSRAIARRHLSHMKYLAHTQSKRTATRDKRRINPGNLSPHSSHLSPYIYSGEAIHGMYELSKSKDKLQLAQFQFDEINQIVESKFQRIQWTWNVRVPHMIGVMMTRYSEMWKKYLALFEDMQQTVKIHAWLEPLESPSPTRSANDSNRLSASTSSHRTRKEEDIIVRQTVVIRRWAEIFRDCITLWNTMYSLEQLHVSQLMIWWCPSYLDTFQNTTDSKVVKKSTKKSGQVNTIDHQLDLSDNTQSSLCKIPNPCNMMCTIWLNALEKTADSALQTSIHNDKFTNSLQTTNNTTAPVSIPSLAKSFHTITHALTLFVDTIEAIENHEKGIQGLVQEVDTANNCVKKFKQQQGKSVSQAASQKSGGIRRLYEISHNDASDAKSIIDQYIFAANKAKYKLHHAIQDNRALREVKLESSQTDIWRLFVQSSKEFYQGYADLGRMFENMSESTLELASSMSQTKSSLSFSQRHTFPVTTTLGKSYNTFSPTTRTRFGGPNESQAGEHYSRVESIFSDTNNSLTGSIFFRSDPVFLSDSSMEFCPVKTNTSMSNVRIPGGGSTQSLKLVNMYGSISRMSAVEVPIVTVDAPKESDTAVEASTSSISIPSNQESETPYVGRTSIRQKSLMNNGVLLSPIVSAENITDVCTHSFSETNIYSKKLDLTPATHGKSDLKNTTWTTLSESTSPAQSLPRAAQAYLSAPVTLSSSDLTKIQTSSTELPDMSSNPSTSSLTSSKTPLTKLYSPHTYSAPTTLLKENVPQSKWKGKSATLKCNTKIRDAELFSIKKESASSVQTVPTLATVSIKSHTEAQHVSIQVVDNEVSFPSVTAMGSIQAKMQQKSNTDSKYGSNGLNASTEPESNTRRIENTLMLAPISDSVDTECIRDLETHTDKPKVATVKSMPFYTPPTAIQPSKQQDSSPKDLSQADSPTKNSTTDMAVYSVFNTTTSPTQKQLNINSDTNVNDSASGLSINSPSHMEFTSRSFTNLANSSMPNSPTESNPSSTKPSRYTSAVIEPHFKQSGITNRLHPPPPPYTIVPDQFKNQVSHTSAVDTGARVSSSPSLLLWTNLIPHPPSGTPSHIHTTKRQYRVDSTQNSSKSDLEHPTLSASTDNWPIRHRSAQLLSNNTLPRGLRKPPPPIPKMIQVDQPNTC